MKSDDEYLDDPIKLFDFDSPQRGNPSCDSFDKATGKNNLIEAFESVKHVNCLPSRVKLVDCAMFPWYFKRYTQQILDKTHIYDLTSDSDTDIDVECFTEVNSDIQINNVSEKINKSYNSIVKDTSEESVAAKGIKYIKHKKEDNEIQKALSQKNVTHVDLKRNKGLVGMTIMPKTLDAKRVHHSTKIITPKINKVIMKKLPREKAAKKRLNYAAFISPVSCEKEKLHINLNMGVRTENAKQNDNFKFELDQTFGITKSNASLNGPTVLTKNETSLNHVRNIQISTIYKNSQMKTIEAVKSNLLASELKATAKEKTIVKEKICASQSLIDTAEEENQPNSLFISCDTRGKEISEEGVKVVKQDSDSAPKDLDVRRKTAILSRKNHNTMDYSINSELYKGDSPKQDSPEVSSKEYIEQVLHTIRTQDKALKVQENEAIQPIKIYSTNDHCHNNVLKTNSNANMHILNINYLNTISSGNNNIKSFPMSSNHTVNVNQTSVDKTASFPNAIFSSDQLETRMVTSTNHSNFVNEIGKSVPNSYSSAIILRPTRRGYVPMTRFSQANPNIQDFTFYGCGRDPRFIANPVNIALPNNRFPSPGRNRYPLPYSLAPFQAFNDGPLRPNRQTLEPYSTRLSFPPVHMTSKPLSSYFASVQKNNDPLTVNTSDPAINSVKINNCSTNNSTLDPKSLLNDNKITSENKNADTIKNAKFNNSGNTHRLSYSVDNNSKRTVNDDSKSDSRAEVSCARLKRTKIVNEIKHKQGNDTHKQIYPHKGYSPPILPLPLFEKSLGQINSNKQNVDHKYVREMNTLKVKTGRKCNKKSDSVKVSINKEEIKKISLEEYKKRINNINQEMKGSHYKNTSQKNDATTKEADAKNGNIENGLNAHRNNNVERFNTESDLGYDSDSTVIL